MSGPGFHQHLSQRQTQQMVLAPQLRQSLKILQVAALDLRSVIQEELQNNPTLEELPMEGVSLRPAFEGRPLNRRQPIFWEHEGNKAVRDGKWKLAQKWRGPWELYDMEADRTELHNVIAEHADVAAMLQAAWNAWAARAFVDEWTGPDHTNWGEDIRPPKKTK